MLNKEEFDAAAITLLGQSSYDQLTLGDPPSSRPELCELIAKLVFVGRLEAPDEAALAVVRTAARSFWRQ